MISASRRAELKRWARSAVILFVVVTIGIQFIRTERPRGELPGSGKLNEFVAVPISVDALLRRSCYDCHSDETQWPWYAQVAPVSWLLTRDVQHGRSNLDFSRWSVDTVREPTPKQRLTWMCREARRRIMPPLSYIVVHPRARLSGPETNVLCAWTQRSVSVPL